MKKKVMALFLASTMLFSGINVAYAENSADDTSAEPVIEVETEAEPTTEPEITTEEEITTEPTTVEEEEPTTSSTTTTTKTQTSNYTDEKMEYSISMDNGDTKSLTSYIKDTNLTADIFDWYSTDSSIVSVSSEGLLTSRKMGSCTVTATATDGSVRYTYTFDITVSNTTSSSRVTKSFTIYIGDYLDLYDYVDDDYLARDYTWESEYTKYATVSSVGVVKGIKSGDTTITATVDGDDETIVYKFSITVRYDDDDSTTYSSLSSSNKVYAKTEWTLYMSTNDRVDVSGMLEDSPKYYDWEISDEDIVSVNETSGIISGREEGSTKVYAEGSYDYTFTIKVNDDYSVETMSVKGSDEVSVEDYLDEDIDEYSFSSDRKDVATVSSDGEVTGWANGVATILCEHEDGDIIQIIVTVSGMSSSNKTTIEADTETTTLYTAVTQAADDVSLTFSDVASNYWAHTPIMAMTGKGFIRGIGNNKFAPEDSCKRCDFTIVLTQIIGIDKTNVTENYTDVNTTDYFYQYVGAAKAKGIESGVADGKFRPNDYITREEMMVMIYKSLVDAQGDVLNKDTTGLSKFNDSGSVSEENKEAIAALINENVVAGMSETELAPKANITRAQMAQLLNIVYNRIA